MRLDDPRLISECKKLVEQKFYEVSNFSDLIFQAYACGAKFIQVYDSSDKNAITRFYNLDDVVNAVDRDEIRFVNKNEHLERSNGDDWCVEFVNGITIQPISYSNILALLEPGEDIENTICEGSKFRNSALALAALAGLTGGYNMIDQTRRFNEPSIIDVAKSAATPQSSVKNCIAPEYREDPTPDAKYNNTSGIVLAKPNWKRQRIDYQDKHGNTKYSLGLGNLSSRAHNPGNMVVNDMDSAKKIGAINYYQQGKGENKYAIFPNDQAGIKALNNWWFTGNNTKQTVNELLPKFAPRSENDLDSYFKTMRQYCVPLDIPIAQFTSVDKTNLINAIKTHEGFRTKKAREYDKYAAPQYK